MPHSPDLKPICRFAVLTICALPLIVGCLNPVAAPIHSQTDVSELVRSTISDPARAKKTLALLEQRDRLIDETAAMIRQYRTELHALKSNHDAKREIAVEMLDYYNLERAQKQHRFVDLIMAMKSATSESEWKVIAQLELENFDPTEMVHNRHNSGPGMLNTLLGTFLLGGGILGGSPISSEGIEAIGKRAERAIETSRQLAP